MNKVTPHIRQLATRLILYEVSEHAFFAAAPAQTLQACQKLRPQLETLMGNGGFQALLMRALAQANAEVPWLCNVSVNAAGILEETDQEIKPLEPNQLLDGSSVLLGEFFGLLVNFIGATLTLEIVRKAWPDMHVMLSEFILEAPHHDKENSNIPTCVEEGNRGAAS
jgi:hypothetical protein